MRILSIRKLTLLHTPQSNEQAERCNLTIVEIKQLGMLISAKVTEAFWAEEVKSVVHFRKYGSTPNENQEGISPVCQSIRMWGFPVLILYLDLYRRDQYTRC
ncbi:hypothetical protein V1527DRAFT_273132 [Lipomyces starkeyi]